MQNRFYINTTGMEEDSEWAMALQNSESTSRAPKTGVGARRKLKARIRSKTMESGKKSKSKFAEYVEMEKGAGLLSKEEDLRLERKLAKKLKVKKGMLGGNDELSMLLEGIPSVLETVDGDSTLSKSLQDCSSCKKQNQSNYALEEIESEKGSDSMDGLSNSVAPGSNEYDNVEELSLPKVSKKRKTKPEEYSEMEEMQEGDLSAAKALKSKRKLKVREGRLCEDDDDATKVFKGVSSVIDSSENAESRDISHHVNSACKKRQKKKSIGQEQITQTTMVMSSGVSEPVTNHHGINVALERVPTAVPDLVGKTKYMAPHLRSRMQNESEDTAQMHKRVRGLLNRLSESNVESITREISAIFHSLGRSVGAQIIVDEVLASCSGGPRGNEQYAATFAAFVAGMACLVGIDFGAKFLASLANCFEMEYLEEDNLSLRNLTLLLSYLYTFGVCTRCLAFLEFLRISIVPTLHSLQPTFFSPYYMQSAAY